MTSKNKTSLTQLVWENRGEIKFLKGELAHIRSDIYDIKNNHLEHIQADLTKIKEAVVGLRISDGRQEPVVKMAYDAIKYIVFTVIGAGLALIINTKTNG